MRYMVDDWTRERIARLGLLVGRGWSGQRIADDLGTSRSNVFRQAQRFGLSIRGARRLISFDVFISAGAKRGITAEQLVDRLLSEIEGDPVLIDNILDDLDDGNGAQESASRAADKQETRAAQAPLAARPILEASAPHKPC